MKKLFIVLLTLLALSGCQKNTNRWNIIYYPEGFVTYGEQKCEFTEAFPTKENCQEYGREKVKINGKAEYLCGIDVTYNKACEWGAASELALDENAPEEWGKQKERESKFETGFEIFL
ncbi:membrane lipoprotein lipid attachment site-containing protein [Candidatus Peregrinibacteria bacterium]|nr:membrane lipoprotein lipid attachment site-containing protein [Candidatus Peregrinibacteria bacterium]